HGLQILRARFPDFDGFVPARRGEPSSIGAEVHAGDQFLVSPESHTAWRIIVSREGSGIPDTNSVMVASRDDLVADVSEDGVGNGAALGEDDDHLPAARGVHNPKVTIEAGQDDPLAVGMEYDGAALMLVTRLIDLARSRGRVPDLDDAVPRGKGDARGIRTEP